MLSAACHLPLSRVWDWGFTGAFPQGWQQGQAGHVGGAGCMDTGCVRGVCRVETSLGLRLLLTLPSCVCSPALPRVCVFRGSWDLMCPFTAVFGVGRCGLESVDWRDFRPLSLG